MLGDHSDGSDAEAPTQVVASDARLLGETGVTTVGSSSAEQSSASLTGSGHRARSQHGPVLKSHSGLVQSDHLVGSRGRASGLSRTLSARDALQAEEIARTRLFVQAGVILATVAMVSEVITDGDPTIRAVSMPVLALVAVGNAILVRLLKRPKDNAEGLVTAAALCVIVGAFAAIAYWGIFSPAPTALLLAINAFSQNASKRGTGMLYGGIALSHAILATLVISGVLPDLGLVRGAHLSLGEQILGQLLLQALYGCAFLVSRLSRRAMVDAVEQLAKTTRDLAQREALLHEARLDLDRALQVGGPGRYSDQVVGSFRLGVVIGRGGMGEVYEAWSVRDGSEAAVKLLLPHGMADPDLVERFLRETKLTARLDCDNVVRVIEVGGIDDDVPFLAMERLRGQDLAGRLRKSARRMPLDEVVGLVAQVAGGLEAAHAIGVVHRDLKPHNLFWAEGAGSERCWKILDFGVSKLEGADATLTRGAIIGTPTYMAPEQARGDDVDLRADVYALAAIAYRSLTGQPPFSGKDMPSTLLKVVSQMPTRPSTLVALTLQVEAVLAIGMAKDRGDRFASARAFSDALSAAAAGKLDAALRRRAEQLVEAHPWGQRVW